MTDHLELQRQLSLLVGQTVTHIDCVGSSDPKAYEDDAEELRITFSEGKQLLASYAFHPFTLRIRIP